MGVALKRQTTKKKKKKIPMERYSTKHLTSTFQICQGHQKHEDLPNCCNEEESKGT